MRLQIWYAIFLILLTLCFSQQILAGAKATSLKTHPLLNNLPRNLQLGLINQRDGLSQAAVHAVIQDQQGYMWFGTQEGLNRYDGHEIMVYEHIADNPNTLSHDWVWSLIVDDDGVMWVGTNGGGLNRFDRLNNQFLSFQHDPDNPNSLSNNRVRAIFQDDQGLYWIGTDGGGLNRYDPVKESFSHYRFDPADESTLPSDTIYDIHQDKKGNLWIATENGLAQLQKNSDHFIRYLQDSANETSKSNNSVRSITIHPDGKLWIGTHGAGLKVFNPATETFVNYRHKPKDRNSLLSDVVRDILIDEKNSVWVATDNGLNEWREETNEFNAYKNNPTDQTSLVDNRINALYQDRGGVLWIATYDGINHWNYVSDSFTNFYVESGHLNNNVVTSITESSSGLLWASTYGGGITRMDLDKGTVSHYQQNPDNQQSGFEDNVMSLYVDGEDNVWIGTRSSGLGHLDTVTGAYIHYRHDPSDPSSLSANGVTAIYGGANKVLWVGTYGGGLNRIDTESGEFKIFRHSPADTNSLSSDRVLAIVRDHQGKLWIGTENGGLNLMNEQLGTFTRYQHEPENKKSISSNTVWEILESNDGSLWIGTLGGGLNRWQAEDRKTGTPAFQKFDKRHNLQSDTIYGILEDDAGFLWLSGNRGLSQFDPVSRKIRHFNSQNGLIADEFNFGARSKGRNGKMCFGGNRGLVCFDPSSLITNTHVPPIVVNARSNLSPGVLSDSFTERQASLELGYRDPFVAFEFAALDFTSPDKNQYRYRLEGFDDNWVDPGNFRQATYANLPAGDYTFKVIASNNDGLWNEKGATIKLRVIPPLWKTLWAYALYIVLITGVILAYLRIQNIKLMQAAVQQRLLETEVELRTRELAGQNIQLEDANTKLVEASMTDPLTGMKNRRFLYQFIETEIASLERKAWDKSRHDTDKPDEYTLFFMMIDLDHFKSINDKFGHSAGDKALLQVCDILLGIIRHSDTIIRWGGDEFLVVGYAHGIEGIKHLADRIRIGLSQHEFKLGNGKTDRMSGSIGFSPYPFVPEAKLTPKMFNWEQIADIADQAAYISKHNGRNAWTGIWGNDLTEASDLNQMKVSHRQLLADHKVEIASSISGRLKRKSVV